VARAADVLCLGLDDRKSGMAAAMELATQMADAFSFNRAGFESPPDDGDRCTQRLHSRRGTELGIPVPVNHALFTLVKLAEQTGVTVTGRRLFEKFVLA